MLHALGVNNALFAMNILLCIFFLFGIIFVSSLYYYLGFLFLNLLVLVLVLYRKYGYLIFFYAIFLIFKNIIISFFSPVVVSSFAMKCLLGLDFYFLFFMLSFLFVIKKKFFSLKELIFVVILVFYLFIGISKYGINSLIYFRFFIYPFLFYCLGKVLGHYFDDNQIIKFLWLMLIIFSLLVFLEISFSEPYYKLINFTTFFNKKYSVMINLEKLLNIKKRSFFNLSFFENLRYIRAKGSILHSPSFSYLLFTMGVFFFYKKKYFFLVFVLILMVFTAAKGGLLAILVLLFLYTFRNIFFGIRLVFFFCLYIGFVFFLGLKLSNPHIIGLVNSLPVFLSHPLGYGLGFGGTLSTTYSQILVGDSILGIALVQLGINTFWMYFFYYSIIIDKKTKYILNFKDKRLRIFILSFYILLLNSFFQEEPFSPYALGIILFFIARLKRKLER